MGPTEGLDELRPLLSESHQLELVTIARLQNSCLLTAQVIRG